MENVIVTIARQYGSGGKTIGEMYAKDQGINCYSREILRMASDDSGINEMLFNQADELPERDYTFRLGEKGLQRRSDPARRATTSCRTGTFSIIRRKSLSSWRSRNPACSWDAARILF